MGQKSAAEITACKEVLSGHDDSLSVQRGLGTNGRKASLFQVAHYLWRLGCEGSRGVLSHYSSLRPCDSYAQSLILANFCTVKLARDFLRRLALCFISLQRNLKLE